MKRILIFLCIVWAILLITPVCFMSCVPSSDNSDKGHDAKVPLCDDNVTVKVKHTDTGEVSEMNLSDYLICVLTAEMPASFESDALMAQAVAARSYTYNKYLKNRDDPNIFPTHDGADVCTDIGHCKAFLSKEDAIKKWGKSWADEYYDKLCRAVRDTDSEILTYGAVPVNAVFHSASYGRTENAKDVWGGDAPYLKSVESPLGDAAEKSVSKFSVPLYEFKDSILSSYPDAHFPDDTSKWVDSVTRSEGGSVQSITIGGIPLKGTKVREIFSLKSANFVLTLSDTDAVFEVYGSGHGVGLSQYGANALALDGYNYREILAWYYKDTDISNWE